MQNSKSPSSTEIAAKSAIIGNWLIHRLALPFLAITAAIIGLTIFIGESIPTGKELSFVLRRLPTLEVVESRNNSPIAVTPGKYQLEIVNSTALESFLLADKNVRRPISIQGTFEQTAIGFVWRNPFKAERNLVEFETIGVARVSVQGLNAAQAIAVHKSPATLAAIFAGGMVMMCIYASLVSILGRTKIFAFYTFWVWATLALGSITAGYDLIWFGASPSTYWEQTLKHLICALWGVASPALFLAMFRDSIRSAILLRTLKVCWYFGIAACFAAPLLPGKYFMPIFWAGSGVTVFAYAFGLVQIWGSARSRGLVWYGIGWIMQFASVGYELAAATGLVPRTTTPSMVPAGGLAVFFVGIAVAEVLQTERQGRLVALRIAEKARNQLSKLFSSSPAGLISFNHAGAVLDINPKATELLGPAALGLSFGGLMKGAVPSDPLQKAIAPAGIYTVKVPSRQSTRTLQLRVERTKETSEVAVLDVTDAQRVQALLEAQVVSDPLTDLRNRRSLHQEMTRLFGDPEIIKKAMLITLDVHRFRDINAYFGQQAGDAVLRDMATRLKTVFSDELIFRLAADTFVILIVENGEDVGVDLSRMHSLINNEPFYVGRRNITVTITSTAQPLQAYSEADDALNSAKHLLADLRMIGIPFKVFSGDDLALKVWQEEQQFINLIRSEKWTERVEMFAQPLVGLNDSKVRYELLLRIRDGQRYLPPASFLRAAETLGAMPEIDLWVIDQALKWIERLPQTPYYVTANLSGGSLTDPGFFSELNGLLAKHRFAARHLCIEVTESIAVKDLPGAAKFFNALEEAGVALALDDFGQGYTNFSYLSELPAQVVKLDGSIVQNILVSQKHQAIVRCLSDLVHGLGMQCVAEWVENLETADLLAEMGVDVAQGWAFAKPMPLEHWHLAPFPNYTRSRLAPMQALPTSTPRLNDKNLLSVR